MTESSVESFAEAVARHLADAASLVRLQAGCERSARRYTLDNMVNRFGEGILHCLAPV
jgi:hypothetical protein